MTRLPKKRGITQAEADKSLYYRIDYIYVFIFHAFNLDPPTVSGYR